MRASRLPFIDSPGCAISDSFKENAFSLDSFVFGGATWVDNMFTAVKSVEAACMNMNSIRDCLQENWNLTCGTDSLEIMPSHRESSGPGWKVSDEFAEYTSRMGFGLFITAGEAHYMLGSVEGLIRQIKTAAVKLLATNRSLDLFSAACLAVSAHNNLETVGD